MNQAYKVRIYPNEKQKELIEKTIGSCRFLYNKMLEERIEKYKNEDKAKHKTEKEYKEEFEFLKEVSSRALQPHKKKA